METENDYESISIEDDTREDVLRVTKYLAPCTEDPNLLHTVYQNVNQYVLHLEFMVSEFPERFGGLSSSDYLDLVYYRSTRTYFAGGVFQFKDALDNIIYGFTYYSAPDELPDQEEVRTLYERLSASFALRPLAYAPLNPQNVAHVRTWNDPGFPVYLPEGLTTPDYEVYSQATNYGRIRLFTLSEFTTALEEGEVGWQDIVVIDTAPTDIETVVAGVITGSRQGELSHINVRSIRRGTPNGYIKDANTVLKDYEGKLVRLTLGSSGYEITEPVDLQEAETWWTEHRPQLDPLPQANDEFSELVSLSDLAKSTQDSAILTARHGGKATGLGLLYTFMDTDILVDGFSIPFHYYTEFMRSNTIPDPSNYLNRIAYEEYIQILINDPDFRSDSKTRIDRLDDFRDYMRDNGVVSEDLVNDIIEKIIEVYGSTNTKVRFPILIKHRGRFSFQWCRLV